MDTEGLRRAYAEFIAATQQGPFRRPADGGWSAEMVLAHVLVGDRLIAQTASRVMAGENPGFDNHVAQFEPYLRAVIEANGGWGGLVDAVEHGGEELIALAQHIKYGSNCATWFDWCGGR
jgi:hypothetical protein